MYNLFFTGEKQIGKSTIIHQMREQFQGEVGGFTTIVEQSPYERTFFICSANNGDKKDIIGRRKMHGSLEVNLTAFEKTGVSLLKQCFQERVDLIIMDELGVFENKALTFQKKVFECLDSSIPVIGVVKNKSSLFLNVIRHRKDVEVIVVTKENRNHLTQTFLKELTKGSIKTIFKSSFINKIKE